MTVGNSVNSRRQRTQSASERSEFNKSSASSDIVRNRVVSLNSCEKVKKGFYAGAKFDTVPHLVSIPVPPIQWRLDSPRSQSTPSSPITVSGKSEVAPPSPIKLDLESLFGQTHQTQCRAARSTTTELHTLFKSASVPERGRWSRLVNKMYNEEENEVSYPHLKPVTQNETRGSDALVPPNEFKVKSLNGIRKPLAARKLVFDSSTSSSSGSSSGITSPITELNTSRLNVGKSAERRTSGISGKDLMELLKSGSPLLNSPHPMRSNLIRISPSCQFDHYDSADSEYKEITNHLKSLLNVSITA